jgi:putative protease
MLKERIELLSPAGSFDCLEAAVQAGADAIYFGVEQLNMRARSSKSFSITDIEKISKRCKSAKIKFYITLNTVIYEHDLQLLHTILREVRKHDIDAVIASDIAVIMKCNQLGIPVHISTQANVSNFEAVQFYSRYADVIVLARELTLKQIEFICNEIRRKKIAGVSGEPLKIEIFVHGALCMAISGNCYLSLHSHNASANRGACIQNCRHSYKVTDMETNDELLIDHEYIMSPKDLNTIDVLDRILDCGVDVLKIEGRTKGPEYVYHVTKSYREALNAIKRGTYTADKIKDWNTELSKVYNRGFWNGYYLGHKLGEWSHSPGSMATERKIYVGKGSKYYPNIKVGEFIIESGSISEGDTLLITGPDIGVMQEKMKTLVVNGVQVNIAVKNDRITFPVKAKVSSQDKLYKIVNSIHG